MLLGPHTVPNGSCASAIIASACAIRNACAAEDGGCSSCIATSFVCSVVALHSRACSEAAQPLQPEHGASSMSHRHSMHATLATQRRPRSLASARRENCPSSNFFSFSFFGQDTVFMRRKTSVICAGLSRFRSFSEKKHRLKNKTHHSTSHTNSRPKPQPPLTEFCDHDFGLLPSKKQKSQLLCQ